MRIQCQTDVQHLPIGTRLLVTWVSNRLYGNTSLIDPPEIVDKQEVVENTASALVLRRGNGTIHQLAFDDPQIAWQYTETGFRIIFPDGGGIQYHLLQSSIPI